MGKHDEYAAFVEHPRYGRGPRRTWLDPTDEDDVPGGSRYIKLHWHSGPDCRIPNTAIAATMSKQHASTMAVSHYFDVKRTCRDCARPFLFFAEEQKHWYEELGFGLEADCVRCVPCRKQAQGLAQARQRYEELFHVAEPDDAQLLEMAECSVRLIEAGVFAPRHHERVRSLLRRVSDEHAARKQALLAQLES